MNCIHFYDLLYTWFNWIFFLHFSSFDGMKKEAGAQQWCDKKCPTISHNLRTTKHTQTKNLHLAEVDWETWIVVSFSLIYSFILAIIHLVFIWKICKNKNRGRDKNQQRSGVECLLSVNHQNSNKLKMQFQRRAKKRTDTFNVSDVIFFSLSIRMNNNELS